MEEHGEVSFFKRYPPPVCQNLSPTPGAGWVDSFYRVRVGFATPFGFPGALAARRLGPSMTI